MHADDTNYTAVKNGVVVVSGTGPAIRVDENQLVIRDGPKETPPLVLTRAEATRKLRHIVMCGQAGGFVTFDALRWLRDTRVAFSHLDWDGAVVMSTGPRGADQPALRRAQVLICSGAAPEMAVAIAREILRVKLCGQAEVAQLLGWEEASAAIANFAAGIAHEADAKKVLVIEAHAAALYWNLWREMPVRFARRNPRRLNEKAQWVDGRRDAWLRFGPRTSLLTDKPHRATTPGNALLNYLYAVLECEMTIALTAVGLDPGIGLFHADVPGRSSLSLDAIEAVRPYVDCWLAAYLGSSAFANRDFAELPDGEIRLAHPLNSQLAHTAAIWRKACEPVAHWLAHAFASGSGASIGEAIPGDALVIAQQPVGSAMLPEKRKAFPVLAPPLPGFVAPARGRAQLLPQAGVKDDPVPRMCWECGRALVRKQRKFCSNDCTAAYAMGMGEFIRIEGPHSDEGRRQLAEKARMSYVARRAWQEQERPGSPIGRIPRARTPDSAALIQWYSTKLQPLVGSMRPMDIAKVLGVSKNYSIHIKQGRMPHPRHFEALAKLAGIDIPNAELLTV